MYLAVNCKYVCKMNVHPVFYNIYFVLNKNSKNFIIFFFCITFSLNVPLDVVTIDCYCVIHL